MSDIFELDLDLDDLPEFQLLPEGQYPAEIGETKSAEDKNGDPYWRVSMLIHTKDYPVTYDMENAPNGTPVSYGPLYKPRRDGDRRRNNETVEFIKKLGIKTKGMKTINTEEWTGKQALVTIKHGVDSRNGKGVINIVAVEPMV